MTDHEITVSESTTQVALAVVNFVENGVPVKGARVTIRPSALPEMSVECSSLGFQTIELVTDERGHAEHPLVCGAIVDVSVDHRGAVKTIRVPDVESFELIGYPPIQ
jgi:hypothetical protein